LPLRREEKKNKFLPLLEVPKFPNCPARGKRDGEGNTINYLSLSLSYLSTFHISYFFLLAIIPVHHQQERAICDLSQGGRLVRA
jgi:hypothetical protein